MAYNTPFGPTPLIQQGDGSFIDPTTGQQVWESPAGSGNFTISPPGTTDPFEGGSSAPQPYADALQGTSPAWKDYFNGITRYTQSRPSVFDDTSSVLGNNFLTRIADSPAGPFILGGAAAGGFGSGALTADGAIAPEAAGGGLTDLGSGTFDPALASADNVPIGSSYGVTPGYTIDATGNVAAAEGGINAAGVGANAAATAAATGGAGNAGAGLTPFQMGTLGLSALGTLGGIASSSRKPNVPGNAPTAGPNGQPFGTPLNPDTLFSGGSATSLGGNNPLNPNNPILDPSVAKAAQDATYANATSRLNPQWAQAGEMKDTALRNQGLVPGTQAYDAAMRDFNFGKNDAYEQARNAAYGQGLAAQGQGFNQALTAQGQNFNQRLTAQGQGFNQYATNAGLTNQTAGINNAFNQGTYNANIGAQNATTSGLFNLGSTALTAYGLSNMNPVTNGAVQNGLYDLGNRNQYRVS